VVIILDENFGSMAPLRLRASFSLMKLLVE